MSLTSLRGVAQPSGGLQWTSLSLVAVVPGVCGSLITSSLGLESPERLVTAPEAGNLNHSCID